MRVLFFLEALLVPLVTSRVLYTNEPTNEIVARASPSPQNDPPPVPSKYTKGEVFYYDGYQKTSSKFKQFEDMWKQLVDLLNLVDKPDPNDIFELWFNPQYLLEVQHVFGFMWQAVDPNASPPAPKDSPKIWIMSNDYAKQCSGLQGTLAYTQPFSKLSESELSSVVSRSAMGKDDCIIHFCEELMDYYLQHQWTECSQIQPRQVTERLAANLLETLLHELIHCPHIGDKAMKQSNLGSIYLEDDEVYDPYECHMLGQKCSETSVRNPENYGLYAINRHWNDKCDFKLKGPSQPTTSTSKNEMDESHPK